jgi:hypothetical protein
MNISTVGIGIVVGMALVYDTGGTLKLVSVAAGTVGATWLIKKVTSNISLNASQLIEFAGWSIAGVSIVKIVGNAMRSMEVIGAFVGKVGATFAKISEFADKIVFWN